MVGLLTDDAVDRSNLETGSHDNKQINLVPILVQTVMKG